MNTSYNKFVINIKQIRCNKKDKLDEILPHPAVTHSLPASRRSLANGKQTTLTFDDNLTGCFNFIRAISVPPSTLPVYYK